MQENMQPAQLLAPIPGTHGGFFSRLGPLPLPHEHGAWAMLYVPLVGVLVALEPFQLMPSLLLILSVTGAFLAQNVAILLLRGRGEAGSPMWLGLFLAVSAGAGLPLMGLYGRWSLLGLGAVGLAFFAYHAYVSRLPSGRRLIRSERMELFTVGILAMSAPAAYITVCGALDGVAIGSWGASTLFFASSIFYIKMLLTAAKLRSKGTAEDLKAARRPVLLYHLMLAVGVLGVGGVLGGEAGLWTVLAFVPIVARALIAAVRLAPVAPSLKRIGVIECLYSGWFLVCGVMVLRSFQPMGSAMVFPT